MKHSRHVRKVSGLSFLHLRRDFLSEKLKIERVRERESEKEKIEKRGSFLRRMLRRVVKKEERKNFHNIFDDSF